MTDLDRLIAVVESGVYDTFEEVCCEIEYGPGEKPSWVAHITSCAIDWAYLGSLDSALELQEALLPGWDWGGWCRPDPRGAGIR